MSASILGIERRVNHDVELFENVVLFVLGQVGGNNRDVELGLVANEDFAVGVVNYAASGVGANLADPIFVRRAFEEDP